MGAPTENYGATNPAWSLDPAAIAWRAFYRWVETGSSVSEAAEYVRRCCSKTASDAVVERLRSLVLAIGPTLEVGGKPE